MAELHTSRSASAPLRTLHLFAGAGGGILADLILGHVPVCAVELEHSAADVLVARQRDGALPFFPVWDDVRTFAGRPWRGKVDVVAGGFPCQDISVAGSGAGLAGKRSGLWREFARIVREVRPRYAFVENSPALTTRGLDRVLGDLATLGYDARWCVLGADDAGAPHRRKRIWILASLPDANGMRELQRPQGSLTHKRRRTGDVRQNVADAERKRLQGHGRDAGQPQIAPPRNDGAGSCRWWTSEPDVGGVVDGLAAAVDIHGAHAAGDVGRVAGRIPGRVARLRMLGNGQVPATAALAWRILSEGA